MTNAAPKAKINAAKINRGPILDSLPISLHPKRIFIQVVASIQCDNNSRLVWRSVTLASPSGFTSAMMDATMGHEPRTKDAAHGQRPGCSNFEVSGYG
jgi:hypothetical protein